jgi:dUTP pyrophosphatase
MQVKLIHEDAQLPSKAHPNDGGWDLFCCENAILQSSEIRIIRLGIQVAIPIKYVGILKGRSGLAMSGIDPVEFVDYNDHGKLLAGVIDCNYRGEVGVVMKNMGSRQKEIKVGNRVCQMIILPIYDGEIEEVDELDSTDRGEKGFGSSESLLPKKTIPDVSKYLK